MDESPYHKSKAKRLAELRLEQGKASAEAKKQVEASAARALDARRWRQRVEQFQNALAPHLRELRSDGFRWSSDRDNNRLLFKMTFCSFQYYAKKHAWDESYETSVEITPDHFRPGGVDHESAVSALLGKLGHRAPDAKSRYERMKTEERESLLGCLPWVVGALLIAFLIDLS